MTASFQELTLRVRLLVILQFMIVASGFFMNLMVVLSDYTLLRSPLLPKNLWITTGKPSIILAIFHLSMVFITVVFYRKRKGKGFGLLILATLAIDAFIAYLFT